MNSLCNGDLDRPLLIEIFDYHILGNHRLIASGEFSIRKIMTQRTIPLEMVGNHDKYTSMILIKSFEIIETRSFLEYISGGCQISFITAIDFTSSNQDPRNPRSLHYLNPQDYNHYEKALSTVGEILLNYDSDKLVPLFGFGGNVNHQVSHCFALNGNELDPDVYGLKGLMSSYRDSISKIPLDGPTYFSKVIEKAVKYAEDSQTDSKIQQYFVLLILTDGEIHDMTQTIDVIVRGSKAPISIVIVGIGDANFAKMTRLDADENPLIDSNGKKMERDIVQFVPFREVGNSPTALAREVLDEIPREIVNYFTKHDILPNPPIRAPSIDFMLGYHN